jgi:exodeoxyribonuclease V alpha subunit
MMINDTLWKLADHDYLAGGDEVLSDANHAMSLCFMSAAIVEQRADEADPALYSLYQLMHAGLMRPLDIYFALWLGQISDQTTLERALAAALTSYQLSLGHVCLELNSVAGQIPFAAMPNLQLPPLDVWRQQLRDWSVVGLPGTYQPLILDAADRLYLGRWWHYENRIAEVLHQSAQAWLPSAQPDVLATGLRLLFPHHSETQPDWQCLAAVIATLKQLTIISGGPGTGKTYTVTAILALLLAQAQQQSPPLRIALTAPTGKAAIRLAESIRCTKTTWLNSANLALLHPIIAQIPENACTIHRLLGIREHRSKPIHHARNQLPYDVLVVDEASMMDVRLAAVVVDALPPSARLILLGDRHQLASVEAGRVLGDLCGDYSMNTNTLSPALHQYLATTIGFTWPTLAQATDDNCVTANGALQDSIVVLQHSYRFGADSGIGQFAHAVNRGDLEQMQGLLDQNWPDVRYWLLPAALEALLTADIIALYRPCIETPDPQVALAALNRFRLLCAVHDGPYGCEAMNQLVEQILAKAGLIEPTKHSFYQGRPVIITRNDYKLNLYNGDVGLVCADPEQSDRVRVFFDTPEGIRDVIPERLQSITTAFALTIHKAQGSEFDDVFLILPEASPVLNRELLYTGITRARKQLTILANPQGLEKCIKQHTQRTSGLFARLWTQSAASDPQG